jgi:hypothetical protein
MCKRAEANMRKTKNTKKTDKLSEFLDYGGNQLFSQVMNDNLNRSEGIDRLISLLKAYNDSCRRIRGRSGAYRYMVLKANKKGWIGHGSANLYSHRLTAKERNYIEDNVREYIQSGGERARSLKVLRTAVIVFAVVALLFFAVWKKVTSEDYQNKFYGSQIIIEYTEKTSDGLNFSIRTADNISNLVYMEHMPKLFYLTSDSEAQINILPENDIRESAFSNEQSTICLSEADYDTTFLDGKYRVEFEFYIYNDDDEKVYLPAISKEISVGS